jgi:hypothetical protein
MAISKINFRFHHTSFPFSLDALRLRWHFMRSEIDELKAGSLGLTETHSTPRRDPQIRCENTRSQITFNRPQIDGYY